VSAHEDPKGIKLRYVARQPIFDRDKKVFGYEFSFATDMITHFITSIPTLPPAPPSIVRCWSVLMFCATAVAPS